LGGKRGKEPPGPVEGGGGKWGRGIKWGTRKAHQKMSLNQREKLKLAEALEKGVRGGGMSDSN